MDEAVRLGIMVGVGGLAVALGGGLFAWSMTEARRVRRGLKAILRGEPHAMLIAYGQGRGAGFNFQTNNMAVTWDYGAWGLVYDLSELAGVELIVDDQVVGRVHRGETRRALERMGAVDHVRLRMVFDDAAHPDFEMDLWTAAADARKAAPELRDALNEANRWLARAEAILRRQTGAGLPRPTPLVRRQEERVAASEPAAVEAPPWRDDEFGDAEER